MFKFKFFSSHNDSVGEKITFFENFKYLIYGAIIFFVVIENEQFQELNCMNPTFIDVSQLVRCGTGTNEGFIFNVSDVVDYDTVLSGLTVYVQDLTCDATLSIIDTTGNLTEQCNDALPLFTFSEIFCQIPSTIVEFTNIVIAVFFVLLSFQLCVNYKTNFGKPTVVKKVIFSLSSVTLIAALALILVAFSRWVNEASLRTNICRNVDFLASFFIFISALAILLELIVTCLFLRTKPYKSVRDSEIMSSEMAEQNVSTKPEPESASSSLSKSTSASSSSSSSSSSSGVQNDN